MLQLWYAINGEIKMKYYEFTEPRIKSLENTRDVQDVVNEG